eukprot:TRINITY_DN10791_c0_g1_i1.p1 TRINITY_DN10791_c0_g1~~TRINITY_DN10791_c0_g1_i1.p1  ORF type:complete len:267 (+),score=53.97 TRINITY_DN10791_c0_g1_i1:83-802(+)
MKRTIVIGDVHGCLQELHQLLEKLGYDGTDRLIFVGDLVGKGPDGIKVVQFVRSLPNTVVIRGNHEQFCIDYRNNLKQGIVRGIIPTHKEIVYDLDEDSWTWLENLPLSITLEEYNAIVVHAGMVPHLSLESNVAFDLLNIRNMHDKTPMKDASVGVPWASQWKGPMHIIFGHDSARGLQRWEFATGLDTGCCYGGKLTALILPTHELVSIDANQQYCQPKTPLIPGTGTHLNILTSIQ